MAKKPYTLTTGCYIIFNFVQFRICLYVPVYQEAKIPFNILAFMFNSYMQVKAVFESAV